MEPPLYSTNIGYSQQSVEAQWSFNWKCWGKCALALAECAFSPNPVDCLIAKGMGDCASCL